MRQRAVILKRVPFSSEAKLMATFMALSDGRVRTLCTGAPDVIIPRCTNYLGLDGKVRLAPTNTCSRSKTERHTY